MMDGKSLDVKQQKLDELRALLPEIFTEDKIDWEKLQAAFYTFCRHDKLKTNKLLQIRDNGIEFRTI